MNSEKSLTDVMIKQQYLSRVESTGASWGVCGGIIVGVFLGRCWSFMAEKDSGEILFWSSSDLIDLHLRSLSSHFDYLLDAQSYESFLCVQPPLKLNSTPEI